VAISWVAHDNLCLDSLFRNGNEEQRRRYLPGLCKGTSVGALALTEPGAGSDAIGSMRTTARRDGDRYILDGTKLYITDGPIADVFIVYARLDHDGNPPDAAGPRPSVGAFIVDSSPVRAADWHLPDGSRQARDMYVWVETMRCFTYRVLREAARLKAGGGGRGEIHKLTAASVMYAAESLNKILNEAVQIHGGAGYIWETEINRLYRANKLAEIGAGTTEIRKLIISDELLNE
jgi:alkylation response protein AidB-like acyl-CoA dehydrogenase